MVLERRVRGLPRGPWSKRAPWWFWSVGRGVLQEAPGQKGPLVVLERRARGPPRGPWSKRAPGGFGASFWSVGRRVFQEAPGQKGPLVVLERRARSPPRGLRAPGGFGA